MEVGVERGSAEFLIPRRFLESFHRSAIAVVYDSSLGGDAGDLIDASAWRVGSYKVD
jgi:hypothetical protein